jgi:2-polyprenyl-3-methyl-5-hydroxy-6-metoxy-1,4-benzoquinol methylase
MSRQDGVVTPQVNPHFGEEKIVWDDAYSGLYQPVDYSIQFDDQWKFFLEQRAGFHQHTGVETSDVYIDDRIYELTGVKGYLERKKWGALYALVVKWRNRKGQEARRDVGGRLYLEPKFAIDFFSRKYCLDLGCGAGRWTRTLLTLGAKVKSTDISEHALKSTRRFNNDAERLDLFEIKTRRDLQSAFDFTLCWGVLMCTHDPKLAFENAAATVKPGGRMYTMTYAPTYHASDFVVKHRKHYHENLRSLDAKLAYAYSISDTPENAINYFDMLNTYYNWTVREETVHGWYRACGFKEVTTLNRNEPHYCAFHVLGTKA